MANNEYAPLARKMTSRDLAMAMLRRDHDPVVEEAGRRLAGHYNPCETHESAMQYRFCPICLINERDALRKRVRELEDRICYESD